MSNVHCQTGFYKDAAEFLNQGRDLGKTKEEIADSVARAAHANAIPLLDESESLVIAEQLTSLLNVVAKNPPLRLNGLETFSLRTIEEWADEYKWAEVTTSGRMEPVAASGGDNLPDVGAGARERRGRVGNYGVSVSWSFQDMIRAARMIEPIDQLKLSVARKVHDETLNHLIWNGNTALGLTGLLNNSEIPGKQRSSALSGLTGQNLIDAICNEVKEMDDETEGVERPNTLLLPPDQYNRLVTQRQGTDNTTAIIEELRQKLAALTENPGFQIRKVRELKAANNDRNADLMVLLNNDPMYVQYVTSMLFRQLPIQMQGLRFRIPILMRPGGLTFYYPKSCRVISGI